MSLSYGLRQQKRTALFQSKEAGSFSTIVTNIHSIRRIVHHVQHITTAQEIAVRSSKALVGPMYLLERPRPNTTLSTASLIQHILLCYLTVVIYHHLSPFPLSDTSEERMQLTFSFFKAIHRHTVTSDHLTQNR